MSTTAVPLNYDLTTIHFVGSLGRAIGHSVLTLDVHSPAEALRATDIVLGGVLTKYLRGPGAKRYYKVAIGKKDCVLDRDEIGNRSGRSEIWIMPTIRGNDKAWQKIVVGALLITAIFVPALAPFMITAKGGLTVMGSMVMAFGVSLVLGGIAQALTPTPRGPTQGESDQRGSNIFQGNAATVVQGMAIPLVYGRALVPATPISLSIDNNTMATTDAGDVGEDDYDDLEGGGVDYYWPNQRE